MRVVSVNVGMPRAIGTYRGRSVLSGIYKKPVSGPVGVGRYNLLGDKQADPVVHGGEYKAVYAYPSEHYDFWKKKFPGMMLSWGAFGENLTIEGLTEGQARVGDRLLIGTSEFVITEPRLPCFKLGIKFGTQLMVRWFLESEFSGFYLRVLREGQVQAGDQIVRVGTNEAARTIASIVQAVKKGC